MGNGKYIIVNTIGSETPILFPTFLTHFNMAEPFGGKEGVVSAGFFEVGAEETDDDPDNIGVSAYGMSETLKKVSRGEKDAWLIKRLLRQQPLI